MSTTTDPATDDVGQAPPRSERLKDVVGLVLRLFLGVVLIWALMVEHLSPGLSAFYATALLVGILLTQKPLLALFRGEARPFARLRAGGDKGVPAVISDAPDAYAEVFRGVARQLAARISVLKFAAA